MSNPFGYLRDKGSWQKKSQCKDPEAKVCLVCWKKQQDQGGQSTVSEEQNEGNEIKLSEDKMMSLMALF